MEFDKKQHWENVFATKKETEVSWYQKKPDTSLQFFERNKIPKKSLLIIQKRFYFEKQILLKIHKQFWIDRRIIFVNFIMKMRSS